MRKLIIVFGLFVMMLGVQLNFTPDGEAGVILFPEETTINSTLVCQYKNSKKSYEVVNLQVPTDFDSQGCDLPEECDKNESCAECLTGLLDIGLDFDLSNIIPNNRVVYVLNGDVPFIDCLPGD